MTVKATSVEKISRLVISLNGFFGPPIGISVRCRGT